MVTDPASLDSATVATSLPPSRNSKTSRRLHEPFVSREFGASAGKGSLQLNGVVDRNSRGRSSTALALRTTGDASDQAAPLYTVNAVRSDSGGALVARPSPLTDSVLLGKRMSVAEAGCLSVGGSALGTALVPAGLKGAQFKSKPNDAPCTSSGQIEARSTMASPLRSPQDISSLVTDAVCTWGQELGTVLGQAALDSAPPSSRQDGCWSSNRPGLTTTGLFPHTMILRFSSSVHITSVHLRASSVLRLVVKPGDGLLGDGHTGGRTVNLPVLGGHGESRDERSAQQDIDVDVRDVPSFESTRSLTVTIAAGSEAFCSIHRVYALGVRV